MVGCSSLRDTAQKSLKFSHRSLRSRTTCTCISKRFGEGQLGQDNDSGDESFPLVRSPAKLLLLLGETIPSVSSTNPNQNITPVSSCLALSLLPSSVGFPKPTVFFSFAPFFSRSLKAVRCGQGGSRQRLWRCKILANDLVTCDHLYVGVRKSTTVCRRHNKKERKSCGCKWYSRTTCSWLF